MTKLIRLWAVVMSLFAAASLGGGVSAAAVGECADCPPACSDCLDEGVGEGLGEGGAVAPVARPVPLSRHRHSDLI